MGPLEKILHDTEEKMKKALDVVVREFAMIRTGRASPALVENLKVEYYGSAMTLKQIATISIPDANLIVIQPWDINAIPEVEKALLRSELGINPLVDGKVIKLSIPPLSKDRREELVKVVKKISEEGKISIRTIRRDAKEHIEKSEKDKVITEDEKFSGLDRLQKLTDKYSQKIDETLSLKEKELVQM
jgi:ribosome recycling factor